MDAAFLVPEASQTMTGQVERQPASPSGHLAIKVLLTQVGLSALVAVCFWGLKSQVAGYSAMLGGLICVIPNAFLALRLTVPRADPSARSLMRAAYVGELGKLALTVILFIVVFSLVKPLAVGALFAGFIAGQLALFAGFLLDDGDPQQMKRKK